MDCLWPWTVLVSLGSQGPWGPWGPGPQKAHRLLYKLTAPILYKLTAPMTKHEYRANILGVPHAAF